MNVSLSKAKKSYKPQFFAVTILKEFFTPHPNAYELSLEQILHTMGRQDKTLAQNQIWLARRLALLRHYGLIVYLYENSRDVKSTEDRLNVLDKVRLSPKGWKMLYDTVYPLEQQNKAERADKKIVQEQIIQNHQDRHTYQDKHTYQDGHIHRTQENKAIDTKNHNTKTRDTTDHTQEVIGQGQSHPEITGDFDRAIAHEDELRAAPMSETNSTETNSSPEQNSSNSLAKPPILDIAQAIALFKKQNPKYEVTFQVTLRSAKTEKYSKY